MALLDWILVSISLLIVFAAAAYTRQFVKSVADFVAAGRVAGRYLICSARGESLSGVTNTVSRFQQFMVAGFVLTWWETLATPVTILIGITGFVIYRYRQTRAMTLGQFFEMRYSRNFRLFMGILGFLAGLLNYGIFPGVASRFFVYFLGLPESIPLGSHFHIPTYMCVMALYLMCAIAMMVAGGQITLILTDCIEGLLSHLIYVVIAIAIFFTVSWAHMHETMLSRPAGHSMVNPFDAGQVSDFNAWYVLMTLCLGIYGTLAWQIGHGFNSAARTPHEARMATVLEKWRTYARVVMLVLLAVAAVTFAENDAYKVAAKPVHDVLDKITNKQIRSQMEVAVSLRYLLPVGIKGLFAVIMFLGLMAGDSSHLLSWGGIFIQDVVLPFRKTPLSQAAHMKILRLAVIGVALFGFTFSSLFFLGRQIALWFAITMGIVTAGAGAAIIGGLYWKIGTTAGAWTAVLTGASLSLIGIIGKQMNPNFPLNGTQAAFAAMLISASLYAIVSYLTCKQPHNMDKLLNRGIYAVQSDQASGAPKLKRFSLGAILGFNDDFTRRDKFVSAAMFFWSMFWVLVVGIGSAWNLYRPWPKEIWINYWMVTGIALPLVIAVITLVWFSIGAWGDLKYFFTTLKTMKRDASDDGTVRKDDNEELRGKDSVSSRIHA